MLNNKTIENELKDTEKQIEELLLRIKELRKEVSGIAPKQKVLYEQYKTIVKYEYIYTFKSRADNSVKIVNRIKNNKQSYIYYKCDGVMPISVHTTQIIETYIPSKNVILVVEL